jgi:hypothetical protein
MAAIIANTFDVPLVHTSHSTLHPMQNCLASFNGWQIAVTILVVLVAYDQRAQFLP